MHFVETRIQHFEKGGIGLVGRGDFGENLRVPLLLGRRDDRLEIPCWQLG